ncbi:MAG: hypothetical protein AAFN10_18195 [Bacteroidota bacterium]
MKPRHYSWRTLYSGMFQNMMQRIEAHNALYPTRKELITNRSINRVGGQYPGAADLKLIGITTRSMGYPRRIKAGEIETAQNLLKLFCQEVANKINRGSTMVTNAFHANGRKARDAKGCANGANRHLGKLVSCGVLLGHAAKPDSPVYYKDFEQQNGKGVGCVPFKKFGGKYGDYTLLFAHDLVNVDNLPEGVGYMPHVTMDEAVPPYTPMLKRASKEHKSENFKVSHSDGNPTNELITNKVSPLAVENGDPRSIGDLLVIGVSKGDVSIKPLPRASDGNHPKAGNPRQKSQAREKIKKKNSAPRAQFAHYVIGEGAGRAFRELMTSGQIVLAYAVMMMQGFVKKIADRQGMILVESEIDRGIEKCIEIVWNIPEDQRSDKVDLLLHIIDHMGDWLEYRLNQGDKAYIPIPSVWFDRKAKSNIWKAYHRYYLKYREQGQAFRDADLLRKKDQSYDPTQDKQKATQSLLHEYAFLLKRFQMHRHPTDSRIRSAGIDRAAALFRKMLQDRRAPIRDLIDVMAWYITSDSQSAKFWREEAGIKGLRSYSGFVKHFDKMFEQMTSEKQRIVESMKAKKFQKRLHEYRIKKGW